jgi:hypothetical protein
MYIYICGIIYSAQRDCRYVGGTEVSVILYILSVFVYTESRAVPNVSQTDIRQESRASPCRESDTAQLLSEWLPPKRVVDAEKMFGTPTITDSRDVGEQVSHRQEAVIRANSH